MRKIKMACGCIFTLGMLFFSLKFCTDLAERKSSDFKYHPFFEQEEDFDILFLGTSHVINGIFPMELWKDYGLVSYNFGGHGNAVATSYWVMKNALNHTTPKLVVVDCLGIGYDAKTSGAFDQVHLSFDAFPFSITKCFAVYDLLNDSVMKKNEEAGAVSDTAQRTELSLLWDYSVYHSRWNELSFEDFQRASSREKGAESRIAVSVPGQVPDVAPDKKLEGGRVAIDYLCKIIEECKSRDIDVLLVYLPFPATEGEQMEANRVVDIAKEYEVNYINFLNMNLVNYMTDCYDSYSHLNPSGARKVTDYLGQYISSYYDIADHREDTAYRGWHDDYDDYRNFKAENLKNQSALDIYLMLLADKNYDIFLEIRDAAVFENERYRALLENLGIDCNRVGKYTDGIFVKEGGRHVDLLNHFGTGTGTYQTSIGEVKCMHLKDGGRNVYLGDELLYHVDAKQDANADMRIVVFEKDSMQMVDQVEFTFQGKNDIPSDYIAITEVTR